MHRVVGVTVLLAACSFTPNRAGSASPDADPVGPTGDGPALFVGCHIHDPSLRLCFDFEETTLSPVARDGSTFGHDAQTSDVAAMPRDVEQAVALTTSSSIFIPPTPDLTLTHMTLEAWIRPDGTASPTDAIANPPQFTLGYDGATASCAIGDGKVSHAYQAATGAWTHVACTYAGDKVKLYVNGSVIACSDGPRRIDPGTMGTHLGSHLVGGLDNVRVFGDAVDGEICAHAGSTGCSTSCPD